MENKEHESQMQLFEGRKVRTLWDEEAQEWFFSVVDVVAVLTESADPKQYIKKMRSRDPELNSRWGTICTPTRMMASDGKCYNTQAADMQGMFRIIQSIPSPKAEPFKQWMAQVAEGSVAAQSKIYALKMTPTVGASGAIYGVLMGFAMLYPDARMGLVFPPVYMKAKWFVLIFGGIELLIGITGQGGSVAHFAHLGGLLFGWLLILYWKKKHTLYGTDY